MQLPLTRDFKPLNVEEIIEQCQALPALPAVTLQVMKALNDSESHASAIAEIIGRDPNFAATVLKLSNSAFYGMNKQVTTIKDAVVILGFSEIKRICMTAGTMPILKKPVPAYGLHEDALWMHSLALGIGSRIVARLSRRVQPEDAYIAGLLSDIGKTVLAQFFPKTAHQMIHDGLQAGQTFDQIEALVIGTDHATVGAGLARRWELPETLATAIEFHHRPQAAYDRTLILDCVHVADFLAMTCGIGLGIEGLLYEFDETSLVQLGISTDHLDEALDSFITAFELEVQSVKAGSI